MSKRFHLNHWKSLFPNHYPTLLHIDRLSHTIHQRWLCLGLAGKTQQPPLSLDSIAIFIRRFLFFLLPIWFSSLLRSLSSHPIPSHSVVITFEEIVRMYVCDQTECVTNCAKCQQIFSFKEARSHKRVCVCDEKKRLKKKIRGIEIAHGIALTMQRTALNWI